MPEDGGVERRRLADEEIRRASDLDRVRRFAANRVNVEIVDVDIDTRFCRFPR